MKSHGYCYYYFLFSCIFEVHPEEIGNGDKELWRCGHMWYGIPEFQFQNPTLLEADRWESLIYDGMVPSLMGVEGFEKESSAKIISLKSKWNGRMGCFD